MLHFHCDRCAYEWERHESPWCCPACNGTVLTVSATKKKISAYEWQDQLREQIDKLDTAKKLLEYAVTLPTRANLNRIADKLRSQAAEIDRIQLPGRTF